MNLKPHSFVSPISNPSGPDVEGALPHVYVYGGQRAGLWAGGLLWRQHWRINPYHPSGRTQSEQKEGQRWRVRLSVKKKRLRATLALCSPGLLYLLKGDSCILQPDFYLSRQDRTLKYTKVRKSRKPGYSKHTSTLKKLLNSVKKINISIQWRYNNYWESLTTIYRSENTILVTFTSILFIVIN